LIQLLLPFLQVIIQKEVGQLIQKAVNDNLNKILQTLPFVAPIIKNKMEIDYSLASPIEFGSNYLSLPLNGEFYEIPQHQECPATRYPIPSVVSDSMLQIVLSDYIANSAGFAFQNLGVLEVNITQNEIPSWSPIGLNTTDFRFILPQLYNQFPNDGMLLNLVGESPPFSVFSESGCIVSVYGFLNTFVLQNNGLVLAFTLNGTVTMNATVAITDSNRIVPTLYLLEVNFSLYQSEIGPFDVSVLDSLLNTLFADGVIPIINGLISVGFPIPVIANVQLTNTQIGWGNHFLFVSTDVIYVQPTTSVPIILKSKINLV